MVRAILTVVMLSAAVAWGQRVVLYTSVDQPVASPIVLAFEKQTGIQVVLVTDTEATKSVGLAERIRAEKDNVQADVFWSNEVFHTVRLAEEDLLAGYDSPAAQGIAPQYRDKSSRWTGLALRARVLATAKGSAEARQVKGLEDLLRPELKGKIAMARPSAGTTGGHVAALYALWGDEKADAFFQKLRANGVKLLGGNSVVANEVGRGQFIAGLTDNDDVAAAAEAGGQLNLVLPDQDSIGTLTMPTTVALVKGAPHAEAARKLIDYLLAAEVEKSLIDARFASYSVRQQDQSVKPMQVDYAEAARKMPEAVRRATAILEGR